MNYENPNMQIILLNKGDRVITSNVTEGDWKPGEDEDDW